jgi:SPP1 gp7 family putative phage head morphogenesis protein
MGAIADVSVNIDISKMARPLERRMIQSLALGALDSAVDLGEDLTAEKSEDKKILLSYTIMLKDPEDFSSMKFEEAIRFFKSKGILTPSAFKELELAVKQRAFTVSGIQSRQLLTLIRDELTKTIASGADIRKFRKFIEERVKSAGFIPTKIAGPLGETLSAAHTDVVFRTNVMNSYNAGRAKHQTQPTVLARRPVWQARAVVDKRTRGAHKDFNGKMLLATDTFWQTAYPPYGFSCRCRVITRSRKYLNQVVSGATIHGLPDQGFSSGIGVLL